MIHNNKILIILLGIILLSSISYSPVHANENEIEISVWAWGIQSNENENLLYVVQHGDLTRGETCGEFVGVTVFNGTTYDVVEHIDIDTKVKNQQFMAFDAQKNNLYVIYPDDYESDNLFYSVIDGKTNKIIEINELGTRDDFEELMFDKIKFYYPQNPNNGNIYLTDVMKRTVTVIHDDFDKPEATIHIEDGPNGDVSINPITNKIYVANSGNISGFGTTVSVIDGNTNEVVETIEFEKRPFWIHINPETNILYVLSTEKVLYVVDADTHEIIKEFETKSNHNRITANSNTQILYILDGGGISVIDMKDNTLSEIKRGGNFSINCPTAEDKIGSYLGTYLNYDVLFGLVLLCFAYLTKRNEISGKLVNSKHQWIFSVLPIMWGWALFRIKKIRMGIVLFLGFKLIFGSILTYFWDFPLDVLVFFAITSPSFFYVIQMWTIDWNEQIKNNP